MRGIGSMLGLIAGALILVMVVGCCAAPEALFEKMVNDSAANRAIQEADAARAEAEIEEAKGWARQTEIEAQTQREIRTENAHVLNVIALGEYSQQQLREDILFARQMGLDVDNYVRERKAVSVLDAVGPFWLVTLAGLAALWVVSGLFLLWRAWLWFQKQEVL